MPSLTALEKAVFINTLSASSAIDLDVVDNYLDVIRKHQIKSVAIVLLHSYKNSIHEELLRNYILDKSPHLHISLSSEISPIIGEFDRLNTTCANAYIQPIAEKYLNDLNNHLCSLGIEKFRLIWSKISSPFQINWTRHAMIWPTINIVGNTPTDL